MLRVSRFTEECLGFESSREQVVQQQNMFVNGAHLGEALASEIQTVKSSLSPPDLWRVLAMTLWFIMIDLSKAWTKTVPS